MLMSGTIGILAVGMLLMWPILWPSNSPSYHIIEVPEYGEVAANRQEWAMILNDLNQEIVATIEKDGTTVALIVV